MRFASLASQASLLLASAACSRATCVNGPTVITADTPLSCERQPEAQCEILGCAYNLCPTGGSRRLADATAAAAPGVGGEDEEECIEECRQDPLAPPLSCSDFIDTECPPWAGCIVSEGGAPPDIEAAASQPAQLPALAPLGQVQTDDSTQVDSLAPAPLSPVPAVQESAPPAQVYCEWVDGFGCLGTVPGAEGDVYLNGRITLEMCMQDSSSDDTGCQTADILAWCENYEFPDRPGKTSCLPAGSTYDSAIVFGKAIDGYAECGPRDDAPCQEFREYIFSGFDCPSCALSAKAAALSEAACSAQAGKQACIAASAPRFPGGGSGAAAAPTPAVARPSDNVASCAWVTHMGCIATINNGAEGIKLLENRVQLEACIEYNDVSTTGCPDHAANFCETKRFTDMDLAVCMPTVSTYDSAREFIQHYVTYKGCRALTGADCSAARDYLYVGMGCAECGAWADLSALNEANCTALQTEPDCVGVDKSGHVYQETLGAGAPGAVIPAASAVESGDGAVANPVDDGVEDGGGDTGAAPGVSTALTGPATCMWIEDCCCYPTIEGQIGVDYVGARVMLEFCLFDTADDLSGCKSPQYANTCNEFRFNDIGDGGATLCLPGFATFPSGPDLIDALSIYFTCHGLKDTDCNLARGYLFEAMQCADCGEAARIAAPLEGACKRAPSVTACIDAGTAPGETDAEVIDEVNAGADLGKFAPIARENKDSLPPPGLQRLLKPREVVQPSFTAIAPPAETATAVPVASAARRGAICGAAVAALAAAVAVVAAW